MSSSLSAEAGRAWVKIGILQLRLWLNAMERSALTELTIVCWD
jgi:hypothetical protein